MFSEEHKLKCNETSNKILGAAIEVHKTLGAGLLESAYEACLCYELASLNLAFERQIHFPINYKNIKLDLGYRIDILVEGCVILELKSCESITPLHKAQLMTYLKLTNNWLGLIINFNVPNMKEGIKRVVVG